MTETMELAAAPVAQTTIVPRGRYAGDLPATVAPVVAPEEPAMLAEIATIEAGLAQLDQEFAGIPAAYEAAARAGDATTMRALHERRRDIPIDRSARQHLLIGAKSRLCQARIEALREPLVAAQAETRRLLAAREAAQKAHALALSVSTRLTTRLTGQREQLRHLENESAQLVDDMTQVGRFPGLRRIAS